jgi:hypothetical protein
MAPRRPAPARRAAHPLALLLLAAVALALLGGVAGGLLRAGLPLPGGAVLGHAAVWHGALMVGGFMGTVIGVERAVALRAPLAWAAPALSAGAALALLAGQATATAWVLVAASACFVGANMLLVRRQPARHTVLLLGSAVAWLAGNLLAAGRAAPEAVLPWWFGFLVLTVAAERLEMTRLMRRRPAALPLLSAVLGLLLGGAVLGLVAPVAGGVAYGAGLVALAGWLLAFDIARVTVRTRGLPRYMAWCLLGGYAWLAVGGLAWAATALGLPARDAALHAVALGFLASMVMGHAPVILPAIARIKLQDTPAFYLPLAALHLGLAARLLGGWHDPALRAAGAAANAGALALFALTAVAAARAWRRRHSTEPAGPAGHPVP